MPNNDWVSNPDDVDFLRRTGIDSETSLAKAMRGMEKATYLEIQIRRKEADGTRRSDG
jgi:hypothetical protein